MVPSVLTVRIACSGMWAGSLMIMGPMHEEMSFKIDMSGGQDRESRSSRRSATQTFVHGRRSQMMVCLERN